MIYIIGVNIVDIFFILRLDDKGPFKNLDFRFCFLVITTPELDEKYIDELSNPGLLYNDLTSHSLTISPFKEYLYLKPLYSKRGGSTIRADDFTKSPGKDFFL